MLEARRNEEELREQISSLRARLAQLESSSSRAREAAHQENVVILRQPGPAANPVANATPVFGDVFRTMADNAPVLIWVIGPDGVGTYFNQQWLDFRGSSLADELHGNWLSGIHPEDRPQWLTTFAGALEERQAFKAQYRLRRADGEYRWILSRSAPAFQEGGAFAGFVSSGTDITDEKKAVAELEESLDKTQQAMATTIEAMAKILEARDPHTSGHLRKVAGLARYLAEELGLPKQQIETVYLAALVHDIGKIGIPSEVLVKPAPLTQPEVDMIKNHPRVSYEVLKSIDLPWPIARIVLQHHERLDGSGYPAGLSGADILFAARIIAVADTVEAMSSHRPYRPSLGREEAIAEISRKRGILYDPEVVDACLKVLREGKASGGYQPADPEPAK